MDGGVSSQCKALHFKDKKLGTHSLLPVSGGRILYYKNVQSSLSRRSEMMVCVDREITAKQHPQNIDLEWKWYFSWHCGIL